MTATGILALALGAAEVAAVAMAVSPSPSPDASAPAAPVDGTNAPALDFRWDAPAGCPEQRDVQAKVDALLDRVPEGSARTRVTAIARVRQTETGAWDLRLWMVTATETRERTLQDETCATLADATALVLAIAIAPELMAELDPAELEGIESPAPPVEPEAPKSTPAPVEPAPPPAKPTTPPPSTRRERVPVRGGIRLDAGLDAGTLPRAGFVLGLAPALLLRRARVELVARYGFRRRFRFDDVPNAGADFRMWTLGARGCPVFRTRVPLEFPICGGLEIGQLLARDVNLVAGRHAERLWAAFTLAPALVYVPIRHLAIALAVEGFAAFTRPRFTVGDPPELIHRPWPAGVRAFLGAEVRFP